MAAFYGFDKRGPIYPWSMFISNDLGIRSKNKNRSNLVS
ncbi:uncharacterized protein METZ01_LOCUS469357 [marine metagenome]|uniref:Uncharacterized protein n=1 Tax=marine metagenome TaxID=408172 RepID=A0A383B9L3_9ZZZZ